MNRFRSLAGRLDKLRQRHGAARIEIVEAARPESEFSGACELAVARDGIPTFHFPRKLLVQDWLARFTPSQPTTVAMEHPADDLPGTRALSTDTLTRVK